MFYRWVLKDFLFVLVYSKHCFNVLKLIIFLRGIYQDSFNSGVKDYQCLDLVDNLAAVGVHASLRPCLSFVTVICHCTITALDQTILQPVAERVTLTWLLLLLRLAWLLRLLCRLLLLLRGLLLLLWLWHRLNALATTSLAIILGVVGRPRSSIRIRCLFVWNTNAPTTFNRQKYRLRKRQLRNSHKDTYYNSLTTIWHAGLAHFW